MIKAFVHISNWRSAAAGKSTELTMHLKGYCLLSFKKLYSDSPLYSNVWWWCMRVNCYIWMPRGICVQNCHTLQIVYVWHIICFSTSATLVSRERIWFLSARSNLHWAHIHNFILTCDIHGLAPDALLAFCHSAYWLLPLPSTSWAAISGAHCNILLWYLVCNFINPYHVPL